MWKNYKNLNEFWRGICDRVIVLLLVMVDLVLPILSPQLEMGKVQGLI